MRITQLAVDGFGVWSGLELADLSDELNVFYGPNEAGKTTLMQFVRAIFFGFTDERRARYLPPVHPGRPGGSLEAQVGDVKYDILRHPDHMGDVGHLSILKNDLPIADDERILSGLLGGVDEATFTNVFVFGLREIQELATLGDTQAAEELYHLALGLDRVSLLDVLKELDASRKRLLSDDDRPSLVSQLLSQRERLQSEIDELGQTSVRYLSLLGDRHQLDREIEVLESENQQREEHARELALARALSDRWQRRTLLDEQVNRVSSYEALPADALVRFDAMEARGALLAKRGRILRRKRRALRRQIAELQINEALGRQALRLEALAEQQPWMISLEKQAAQLEAELAELESHRHESKKQWGVEGHAAASSLSSRAISELREAARTLRTTRQEAEALHGEVTAAEEKAAAVKRQVESALSGTKDKGLKHALAEAGQLVADLRKRVQLDERIAQMSQREAELEELGQQHLENQILPTWVLGGLGSLFVLGCALVLLFLIGLVLPATLGDSLSSWPVGAVGVVAAFAAAAMKFGMERNVAGQLDQCQQQSGLLSQQLKQARLDRDELDARLPRGGGPLVTRLQAAEKSLAKLEELVPLETDRDRADYSADATRKKSEALREACVTARKRWKQLLAQYGLPADLPPNQLKSFARGRRQVAGLGSTIAEKKTELQRRRSEHEALAARVTQVVGQVGLKFRSDRPVDQLQQCLVELAEQQARLKRRAELTGEIAKLRRRFLKLKASREKLRRSRARLLRTAGTLDAQEFRRRAGLQADAHRLRAEQAQLQQEITSALSVADTQQRVTAWLSAGENLAQLSAAADEAKRLAGDRLSDARERRGAMSAQIKALVEDQRLTERRMELDIVEKRLAEALERWRVLATCNLLLESVRQFFEREHQPQALREASGYMKRLTGGRYRRVWTPLGEHTLRVDDEQGHSLSVEVLSSGTREQLLLALRMALASSYARRGIHLPLVLDDVLVNFDVGRAKAAAMTLRDFARQGHQVLLFTCHEHIAKLFRNVKAEVRELPDRLRGNVEIIEEPVSKKPRRQREEPTPVVEPEPIEEPIYDEPAPEPEPEPIPEPVAIQPPVIVEPAPMPVVPPVVVERVVVEPRPVAAVRPSPVMIRPLFIPPMVPTFAPPLVSPAPAPEPPRAASRPRRRTVRRLERHRWSAEEFDGELSDRVRGDLWEEWELEADGSGKDTQAA